MVLGSQCESFSLDIWSTEERWNLWGGSSLFQTEWPPLTWGYADSRGPCVTASCGCLAASLTWPNSSFSSWLDALHRWGNWGWGRLMTPVENLTECAFPIDLLVTRMKSRLSQKGKQITIDLLTCFWKGLLRIGFRPSEETGEFDVLYTGGDNAA